MVPGASRGPQQKTYEMVYSALTLCLNIVVATMISARLLVYRYRVTSVLGKTQGLQYVSIVAMVTESALLVVIFNTFFVATVRTHPHLAYIAFAGNVQSQVGAEVLYHVKGGL